MHGCEVRVHVRGFESQDRQFLSDFRKSKRDQRGQLFLNHSGFFRRSETSRKKYFIKWYPFFHRIKKLIFDEKPTIIVSSCLIQLGQKIRSVLKGTLLASFLFPHHGCTLCFLDITGVLFQRHMPHCLVVLSGKRKSGKDFLADALCKAFNDSSVLLRLSAPLKKQYAIEYGLDFDRLLDSSTYKEEHRKKMIAWGEAKRDENPKFFCDLVVEDASIRSQNIAGKFSTKPCQVILQPREFPFKATFSIFLFHILPSLLFVSQNS